MKVVSLDGRPGAPLDWRDRGFAYGDGVFETLRWSGSGFPLLEWHRARLARGLAALAIVIDDVERVWGALIDAMPAGRAAVAKLIVTRGVGARGYSPHDADRPTIVALVDAAPALGRAGDRGVLRWCAMTLAPQPRLAGIKHLNRLEQVLARGEWIDPAIDDGLLCDPSHHVICATRANVFCVLDGVLTTPAIESCGVAGVARAALLESAGLAAVVRPIARVEVDHAGEVFLTNAVRGVMPVARIDAVDYRTGPVTARALAALSAVGMTAASR